MSETIGSGTAAAPRKGLLLAFLCFGVFMVYLDATIVNVALPDIQHELTAGITQLQWIVDAYALAFACLLLTSGTLGDILGRKRLFLGGLLGFTLSSVMCALAGSIGVLLVGRALQGICGSVMIPVSLALVSAAYTDPAARAKAIGIWAGIGGVALSAGPVAGGVLVDHVGWQSIFWINVPIGVLAALALARLLTENRSPRARRPDLLGQALFIVAIAALAYALIEGNSRGWASAVIVGSFALSAVTLVAFVFWELRQPDPMLPLKLFRSPVVAVAGAVNFLSLFGLFAAIFLLTLVLQSLQGLSSVETGVRFLALTVPIMIASFAASVVAARAGSRWPIVAGSVLSAAGLFGLTALDVDTGFGGYWWALALLGVGVSFTGAPATVALLDSVPPEQAGTASGVSNTFRQVGAVFGVALAGALLLRHLRDALPGALSVAPLPQEVRARAYEQLSGGDLSRAGALPPSVRRPVMDAVGPVFIDGMHLVTEVAAAGTLVGGLCALVLLRGRRGGAAPGPETEAHREAPEAAIGRRRA
ncbi:MFS transporter [Streptomyces sp. SDr-06]|uniref:MFS transporter n=1 Tax=Streptomyces sp. SDr-06 TaxID=2267702 RepID=UPI000DE9DA90|nr:MFS transporter [Streptomyces sp. SDr-06]RCH65706.1 MFS transporter [Streptomyces sp. SDr-06]